MKANHIFAIAVMALAIATLPAEAQTRKEKRAAKREQWKMEQRHKAEEAELRHKMRLDSIANAKKVEEQRAARAEAERQAAEAKRQTAEAERKAALDEAKAKQRKAEEEAAMKEVEFVDPCGEWVSAGDRFFAHGVGEDLDQQLSVDIARTTALEELASQISTKVQSLVSNYRKQERKSTSRESLGRIEGLTTTEIDQATGYRIACRKQMTFIQNGQRIYKTYIVLEISEDIILNGLYSTIQQDEELSVDAEYEAFKKEFDERFMQPQQPQTEEKTEEQDQSAVAGEEESAKHETQRENESEREMSMDDY